MIKTILAIIVLTLVSGPAMADPTPPTEFTRYNSGGGNDQTQIPSSYNSDSVCSFSYLYGSGAHAGVANWPNGYPKSGLTESLERDATPGNYLTAKTNSSSGVAYAVVSCAPFANFENVWPVPWQTSTNTSVTHAWGVGSGQGTVSASSRLWDTNSFCFLRGVGGVSKSGEAAYVYRYNDAASPTGQYWGLYTAGSPPLSSTSQCVYLGRSYEWYGIRSATANQTVNLDIGPTEGICVVSGVWGDLDDGYAGIQASPMTYPTWGVYQLVTSGAVTYAQAYCVPYADPNG